MKILRFFLRQLAAAMPVIGALALTPAGGAAGQVTLFPVADTALSENWSGNNFGGMPFAMSGTTQNFTANRALFRFDPSDALPRGAVITSASLSLEVTREPEDGYNISDFGVHRVLRSWSEGDNVTPAGSPSPASGAPADSGEATWNFRHALLEPWGAPGGQAGVDYVAAASASTTVYGVGDSPYVFSSQGMVDDVQFWLAHPESNFGWMLVSQAESLDFTARRFGTREDPLNIPTLNVDFDMAPEPSPLTLSLLACLVLLARPGRSMPDER